MAKHTCSNCGLSFETEAELKNHKRKYCTDSSYADVAKLDARLADLRHSKPEDRAGLQEIRDYLGAPSNETPALFQGAGDLGSLPPRPAWPSRGSDRGTLLEQAEKLGADRQRQRELLEGHDKDTLSILKDLGERKERELKAQIEKEEINRAIKVVDKSELDVLKGQKKRELEQLAREREGVRVKETGLMDAIATMEGQLLEQEQYFRRERALAESSEPARRGAALKGLRDKELAWAESRATQVAQVKMERERLEKERQRIMRELEQVQTKGFHMNTPGPGQGGTKLDAAQGGLARLGSGFRGNAAAQRVGSSMTLGRPPSGLGPGALEPSLKDQLVKDQVRINQLRAEQMVYRENRGAAGMDIDEIDVLERELHKQPSYAQGLARLGQDLAQSPDKADRVGYLDALRGKLEHEAAGPESSPNPKGRPPPAQAGGKPSTAKWAQQPDLSKPPPPTKGLMSKLDDLEGLLLRGAGAGNEAPVNPQDFAGPPQRQMQQPPMPQSNPVMPGAPPTLGGGAGMAGMMPGGPQQFPPPGLQQPQWPNQGFGAPQPNPYNFQAPASDPAMVQLAHMVQNQDEENRKLRGVLEGFGRNANTQDELDGVIKGAQQVLQRLGGAAGGGAGPPGSANGAARDGAGPMGGGGGSLAAADLPDEFAFRQNEPRCEDLEVEERALMNLAAQEYDQLRVLEKLPKDSELYAYKLKQYKELSAMRAEVEKVLQEQRLEKIKRDFEKQKVDEERGQRHAEWLEAQKRVILEGRIGGGAAMPQPQVQYRPPSGGSRSSTDSRDHAAGRQQQARPPPTGAPPEPAYSQQQRGQQLSQKAPSFRQDRQSDRQAVQSQQSYGRQRSQRREGYDPQEGFLIQVDAVFGVPRQVRRLRVVYLAVDGATSQQNEPSLAGPGDAEPETGNDRLNKVLLGTRELIYDIEPRPDARLLLEMQAVDLAQKAGFTGFGWTWLDLFDSQGGLVRGEWCLPAYAGAPSLELVEKSGARELTPTPTVTLVVRVGIPGDEVNWPPVDSATNPANYIIPEYHRGIRRPSRSESRVSGPGRQVSQLGQRDLNYRNAGLRMALHYAVTANSYSDLTIKIQIQSVDGNVLLQDDGRPCEAEAPDLPQPVTQTQAQRGDRVMVSPDGVAVIGAAQASSPDQLAQYRQRATGISERPLGQPVVVRPLDELEAAWSRDLYNLFWDQQRTKPLYLVAQLYSRAGGAALQPIAYAAFEICHRDSGELKFGFHEEPLWQPPVSLAPQGQRQLSDERIGFSVFELDDDRPSSGVVSEQYLHNTNKQFTLSEGWTQGDGLDIYVDGARLLPDNVTITKLRVRVVDSGLADVQPEQSILANVERSTLRNQFYGLKFALRPTRKLKPTTLVFITIETVDKSSNKARYAGFSYFPLFMDANEGIPPVNDSAKQLAPLLGNYQMPLFSGRVNETTPFTYERFVYLERAPTASVLLRVVKAPRNNAISIAAPEYKEGLYGTAYFNVTEDELKVMKLRRRRPNPPLGVVVNDLLAANGINTSQPSAGDLRLLDKLVKCKKDTPMLDLNYHSQYEPSLGVRVNVEAIHDNKEQGFLAVMASVVPPAAYYDEDHPDSGKNVFTFTDPDFDSDHVTAKFNEGDALVIGFEAGAQGLSLLLDISIYLPQQQQYVDYGFALCPMLDKLETDVTKQTSEWYVVSGVFTLPVYKGAISPQVVDALLDSNDHLATLQDMAAKGSITPLGTTSVILRLVDAPRKYHFHKTIDQQPPMTRYVEPAAVKALTYQKKGGGKRLADLVPAAWARDPAGFADHLEREFRARMELS